MTPQWHRPAPTARQWRNDLALAAALAAGTVASNLLGREAGMELAGVRPALGEEIAWCLAVSLPLALRRRYPLAVLVAVGAAFIGLQSRFVAETQLSSICLFMALFTAGAWGRDRTLTRATRLVVVAVMFAWLAYALSATAWGEAPPDEASGSLLAPATAAAIWLTAVNVLYFGAGWAFGDLAWQQARQQALLEERTVELARERDENARRAVLDERVRIARELHDVVAHHVSVMGVQAGAARVVLDRDVEASRAALANIETSARTAVEEMRRLLGVLRDVREESGGEPGGAGPGPRPGLATGADAPAPGLAALPALLDRARQAGLQVDFEVVGTAVDVPDSVAVSAYRVVQEALTNTVRHAAATRVDVRLRYPAGAVEVEVVDDGRASVPADGASGGTGAGETTGDVIGGVTPRRGLGQLGMRERVAMHDGVLEVGPRPGGGYRVRARFQLPAGVVAAR